jgi:hypothetical protein
MKHVGTGAVLGMVLSTVLGCRSTSVEEMEIARDIRVGDEWLVIRLDPAITAARPQNDLFLDVAEVVEVAKAPPGCIRLRDGAVATLEVGLVGEMGERVEIRHFSVVGQNERVFVWGPTKNLPGARGRAPFRIAKVELRSTRMLSIRRMLLLSYDPRAFKDGVAFPR